MSGAFLVTASAHPFARLLLAHGAGAPMDSDFMESLAAALAAEGVEVIRFEFPYMSERRHTGRKRPPDKTPQLLAHWGSVVTTQRGGDLPLWIGGKSMGGRMATLWAATAEAPVMGVVCFGYPFHPAGKPEALRVDHLRSFPMPLLVVQGERDALGSRPEVAGYQLTVHIEWLAAADHDLKPLKSTGIRHSDSITTAARAAADFMRACGGPAKAHKG